MIEKEENDVFTTNQAQAAPRPEPAPPPRYLPPDPRRKNVALATVLSLMPGLGHVYLGYYHLGFIHILIFASLVTILSKGAGGMEPLFGLSLGFFVLYNIVDGGRRASLYNQVLDAGAAGALPEVVLPRNRGSMLGGVVLMILGGMMLLHTKFDMDMYWLEEWWPVAPILLGAYLFQKDRSSRRENE